MSSSATVAQFLKKGSFPDKGFVVVVGSEELLHRNLLKKLQREGKNYNLYRGDEIDWEQFVSILGERNLFGGSKGANVVWGFEKFLSKLKAGHKKKLAALLKRGTGNLVILSILTDLKKGDLAKEPFKSLAGSGALFLTAAPLNRNQVAALIAKKFSSAGIEVEKGVIEYLVETFGELEFLRNEVEKLITYALDKGKLTLAEVKELCFGNPKYTVFDLQRAFFERDRQKVLEIYRALSVGMADYEKTPLLLQIEGLLLSTANRLLLLKEKLSQTGDFNEAAKAAGITFAFQRAQFQSWLPLWSEAELKRLIVALYRLDYSLKVEFALADEVFKKFLALTL